MNFKDEYQKANQHIVPDEAFQKEMQAKMKQMEDVKETAQENENEKWYHQPSFVVVCFVIFIIIIGGILLWNGVQRNPQLKAGNGTFDVNVGNVTTSGTYQNPTEDNQTTSEKGGIFSPARWYEEGADAEEIYQSFYQCLCDSDGLEAVYQSSDNTFEEGDRMNTGDIEKLTKKLASGKEGSVLFGGSSVLNYMVECKNGVIIKFKIYDEHLLKFNDINTIYEY